MIVNYIGAIITIGLLLVLVRIIFIYGNLPKVEKQDKKDQKKQISHDLHENIYSNKKPKVMTVIVKIVLTIFAFIIATFLIGVFKAGAGSESPGVIGLVIGAGLIAGIVAIWKYKPADIDNNDIHKLDKD